MFYPISAGRLFLMILIYEPRQHGGTRVEGRRGFGIHHWDIQARVTAVDGLGLRSYLGTESEMIYNYTCFFTLVVGGDSPWRVEALPRMEPSCHFSR